MISTGSVYDKKFERGYRILVMRHWPRGISKTKIDLWLKELGPSKELLDAYRSGHIPWTSFQQSYRNELKRQAELLVKVKYLEQVYGHVVLLCWERIPPQKYCHRLILKEILQELPGKSQ